MFSEGKPGPRSGQALTSLAYTFSPGFLSWGLGWGRILFFCFLIYLYVYGPHGHDVEDGTSRGSGFGFHYMASREIKLRSALMASAFMKHWAISSAHQFGLSVLNIHFMFFKTYFKKTLKSPEETLVVGVIYRNSSCQESVLFCMQELVTLEEAATVISYPTSNISGLFSYLIHWTCYTTK